MSDFPTVGRRYLVWFRGVLQHETYEFYEDDFGCFWDRHDIDEMLPFEPESDRWIGISEAEAKLAAADAAVPEYMLPSDCPHYKLSESDGLWVLRDAWCKGWNECRAEIIEAQTPRYGEKDRQVLEKAEKLIDEISAAIAAAGDSHV